MNIQLTLAYRYLSGRKLRTFLTTLAVVFGVLVIFGMNIILPTMIEALQANVQGASGLVDFSATHISGEPFSINVADKLKNVDGVRAYSPSLTRVVNIPADFYDDDSNQPDKVTALSLVGVIPEAARSVRAYPLVEGRYLEDTDTNAVIISRTLSDSLKVNLGDTIRVPSVNGTADLTVVGILPARTSPGNEELLVNLPTAQTITNDVNEINTIDIVIETFAQEDRRNEIQNNIQTALGKDYTVGTQLNADTQMFASLQLGQAMMNLFGVFALFMGGFIIFNTFRTIVAERRRDIGMLRALGANRKTIVGIILTEGLFQGVLGTAVGIFLGYLMGAGIVKAMTPIMSQFLNLKIGEPVVTPTLIAVSILLGVGVTVAAGLFPALSASKVTPLEALRPSANEKLFEGRTSKSAVGGAVIIILTLIAILSGRAELIMPGGFFFLLGLVLITPALVRPLALMFGKILALFYARRGISDLAQGNLTRQPSRAAVTASTTMLALTVIIAIGGMISSLTFTLYDLIRANLGSDYLFIPPSIALWSSNIGANADFAEQLKHVDGVDDVSALRYSSAVSNGQPISLLSMDPVSFQHVSALFFQKNIFADDESAYASLNEGRNMIVNGALLSALKKNVGDSIEVVTPDGTFEYRIVAVATDMLNAKVTTGYISHANMKKDFGVQDDVFIQLNLKKDADRQAADTAIRALSAKYPTFKVISGVEYYNTMKSQMDATFASLYVLFLVLAIPSLIAMINTLTIGVIERTREIGMIRAVGGTRKQIRMMVVSEALLLSAIGTAFGILGGLYLGYVIVIALEAIFPLGFVFPTSGILVGIAIGLLFGVFAAVIPARQASRMNVVEALRYE
ncbi:MAG: ABC transporter permease [Anaerolineaceae bacterium]|nr:MAG: ABC transporter permease [Anaerolineaceae bacterium]